MTNVPRNIERRVESGASVRSLDIKDIRVEESDDDATHYRVVINDPDAEEGENPSFVAVHPDISGGLNVFGNRLEAGLDAVRRRLLGVEEQEDQELQETREQLEEAGHPNATGEDVEYGPGPQPNVEGVLDGGYNDGDVRVESTTEMDLPEPQNTQETSSSERTGEENDSREKGNSDDTVTTRPQTQNDTTMNEESEIPDGFWGTIAETAIDAHEIESKGHERAAEAMLEEIQDRIDERLAGDDDA